MPNDDSVRHAVLGRRGEFEVQKAVLFGRFYEIRLDGPFWFADILSSFLYLISWAQVFVMHLCPRLLFVRILRVILRLCVKQRLNTRSYGLNAVVVLRAVQYIVANCQHFQQHCRNIVTVVVRFVVFRVLL